jgi:hypothetical protein
MPATEDIEILSLNLVHFLVSVELIDFRLDFWIVKHQEFLDGIIKSHLLHAILPSLSCLSDFLLLYVWKSITSPDFETANLIQLPIIDFV